MLRFHHQSVPDERHDHLGAVGWGVAMRRHLPLGAEDFALPPGVRSFLSQDERLLHRLAARVQAGRGAEAYALNRDLKQPALGPLAPARHARMD